MAGGIKAVAFDMGGVLTKSAFGFIEQVEKELGLPPKSFMQVAMSDKDIMKRYNDMQEGRIIVDEFEEHLMRMLNDKFPATIGKPFRPFTALKAPRSKESLNDKMVKAAVDLKSKGYKVALLTNNWFYDEAKTVSTQAWFEVLPMDTFDVVMESCREGICKPKAAVFEVLLRKLGVEPSQCAFVDDFAWNLAEAKAMGIQCIHMTDTDQALTQLEELLQMQAGTLTANM